MRFLNNRAVFVAQAKVDSKGLCHSPVILEKRRIIPIVQLQSRITYLNRGLQRGTGKEIFQRGRVQGSCRVRGIRGVSAEERDTAAGVAESRIGHIVAMQFATKNHCVLARRVGDVIDELLDAVGALKFRPLEPPQPGEKVTAKANTGKTAREGPGLSGIEAVGGGRGVDVTGQSRLVQEIIAEAHLIHPTRAGSPDPVTAR